MLFAKIKDNEPQIKITGCGMIKICDSKFRIFFKTSSKFLFDLPRNDYDITDILQTNISIDQSLCQFFAAKIYQIVAEYTTPQC